MTQHQCHYDVETTQRRINDVVIASCVCPFGWLLRILTVSLTHWGRVTHICVGKLTIIDSDNVLSPGRRQAIIWTNAGILLVGPLGTNFSEILIEIDTFSFKKMYLKMSSVKWRPFCLGLNMLRLLAIPRTAPNGVEIACWRGLHKQTVKESIPLGFDSELASGDLSFSRSWLLSACCQTLGRH